MTCDDVRQAFSDLYDETLSGPRLVTLTQHLTTCPACREEWARFRQAMQAMAALGEAEPSPGFAARVRQRLEAPRRWARVLRWLFIPLRVKVPIQAVALVLLVFAGLLLYQGSPEVRRAIAPLEAPSPPAARQAPAPSAPPAAGERARPEEMPAPRVDTRREGQLAPQAPPLPASAPPPPAPSEAERRRERTKEAGKIGAPSEAPKVAEPSQEFHAKRPEPGLAARQPVPYAAPAPAQGQAGPAKERQATSAPATPADQLYSAALTDLGRQHYDQAIDNLRAFIQRHPRDARIPDARLRLGNAYVAQQRFEDAIPQYEVLVRDFPDSPLIPAALYRQAQARLAMGDHAGCQLLRDLTDRYPQAPEAAPAREALASRCP